MMNFSKKVFPRVTQRYQLKPVPGSLLLPARPLTAISLASKQTLVFGYRLTAQLLIKPLTAVYEKVVDITVTPVNTTKITVAHSPNSLN